jgi:hypothetical protein
MTVARTVRIARRESRAGYSVIFEIASMPDKLKMNPTKMPQLWNNPLSGRIIVACYMAVPAEEKIIVVNVASVKAEMMRAKPPECFGPNQLTEPTTLEI